MSDTPELLPPEGAEDWSSHWLYHPYDHTLFVWTWSAKKVWAAYGGTEISPAEMADDGWSYYAPARPDDATERARLEGEVTRLRKWINLLLPIVAGCADEGMIIDGHDAQEAIVAIASDLGFTENQDWTGAAIQEALHHGR